MKLRRVGFPEGELAERNVVTEERKAFKDYFDREAAARLANQVSGASTKFDRRKFIRLSTRELETLEFNDRVKLFSRSLRESLPASVPRALGVLTRSLPERLPDCEAVTDGWLQWPVGQFIADYGLEWVDESFEAMIELTQRFSSEFAVRPFVEHRADESFRRLLLLADHENPHVRRWCSEGVRPRLPWGKKLTSLVENPTPIFPILEKLKDDPELYVRRSVANNLNDIAKDHPIRVTDVCSSWSGGGAEREWVIRHALRTLVKNGDPGALAVTGFNRPSKIKLDLEVSPKRIKIGESVQLRALIENASKKRQALMVDFVVHYVRKKDKHSAKVFKWKTLQIDGGEQVELTKVFPLKKTTVRALYPGQHRIDVQVNGVRLTSAAFHLKA